MKGFEVKVVDNSRIFLDALPPQIEAALEAAGNQIVGYAIDILTAKIPRHSGSWYVSKGASGLKGSSVALLSRAARTLRVQRTVP